MGDTPHLPFLALGSALRAMRLRAKESVAEVSSAVEVPIERVGSFENGEQRPPEDVLDLIINHYDLPDKEADKLWDLAGYDKKADTTSFEEIATTRQPVMILPIDSRIVYTDMVHVIANDFGVVINFLQGNGTKAQPIAVSRVGMSREHAKSVLEVLQKTLNQSDKQKPAQKMLKAPDAKKNPKTDQ